MENQKTALILIGYQNDYFAKDGILKDIIEESSNENKVLEHTVNLLKSLDGLLIVSTPILFTENYGELIDPVGILEKIKDAGAFREGEKGVETVPELNEFQDKIVTIEGRRCLNAFVHTQLDNLLKSQGITNIVLAGAVCSISIDSTGRAAYERGYNVTMLSDCIAGRSVFEQNFYMNSVFPLYAQVKTSKEFLKEMNQQASIIDEWR